MSILIANVLILGLTICVLALNLKLYTEILKDASQNRRAAAKPEGGSRE